MKNKVNIKASLKQVFAYMKGSAYLVFIALVLAAISAIITIITPNKVGEITTLMQEGLLNGIDLSQISSLCIVLISIYIISSLMSYIVHYLMAKVTLETSKQMRSDLSRKINRVELSYFNKTSYGDVLSRITNDVQTAQQGLTNSLPTIISSITQFLGCLIMMFITQWRLALCVVIVTILGIVLLMLVMSNSQKYFIKRQRSLGALNGYVEEMYSGHQVVRISRANEQIKDRFNVLNNDVYEANWKSQFLSGVMQPLMNVVGNFGYVAVCVVGAALAISNVIDFGVIISFILYVRLFTSPLSQIAQGMMNMQTALASCNRVFEFLDSEEYSDESDKENVLKDIKGDVEFTNVQFAYPEHEDKIIIKDFNAVVKAGQKVAIVGPTGAGKTTMVNLLMRFFEINKGKITIDGISTKELPRHEVHQIFGMVLQDTWLFEGTVRENLIYNMEGISEERLIEVCKACGIYRFIHSLPNGFDTILNEATTISSGQKQLLTIARAMLQDAPMLILDEATSSVDTRTEVKIQKAMDELTKNRTSFVIAHRLSTIKNADLILVMNEGDVIESGTHDELMALNGFYTNLYNSQFQES